jgi:hypothetical protein
LNIKWLRINKFNKSLFIIKNNTDYYVKHWFFTGFTNPQTSGLMPSSFPSQP